MLPGGKVKMPTYSYRCTKCEKVFDAFHSMSCTSPQYCPDCGAVGSKLLSASSVIFKGTGFYSTDYRDSGYLEAQKKDTTVPSAEAKTSNTAEAKPTETKTVETKASDSKPKANKSKE